MLYCAASTKALVFFVYLAALAVMRKLTGRAKLFNSFFELECRAVHAPFHDTSLCFAHNAEGLAERSVLLAKNAAPTALAIPAVQCRI